ncbi:MAG: hypothetical protein JO354_14070 [Verrucomicrobia bacterium]|nr:hypothetical protein [Verrucomicrobiota bacterium]
MWSALGIYAVAAAVFGTAQAGFVNADFVAYATIAHRWQEHQPTISGCWSPLFSWMLTPLISVGINDLLAGRFLLVGFGAIYVAAVLTFAGRVLPEGMPARFAVMSGTVACAILQATLWANYLLDPDLIACALFFCYLTLSRAGLERESKALFAGVAGGMAFLAKAYFLPFILVHALLLRVFSRSSFPKFLAGMLAIALPWIVVLSVQYHHFTVSTAGASNHANLSPANYGRNLLWKPGLVRDYIIDPRLGPDWSPFHDRAHLQHQAGLIGKNVFDSISQIAPWLLLVIIAIASLVLSGGRRQERNGALRGVVARSVITAVLSAAGYWLVQIQPRYFAPVAAPLLCLAGLACFARAAQRLRLALTPTMAFIIVGAFSVQDGYRLVQTATRHPQSHYLPEYGKIAAQIQEFGGLDHLVACNRWHDGLIVAYAANRVGEYLGTPNPRTNQSIQQQLESARAASYIRWANPAASPSALPPVDQFVPGAPWHRMVTFANPANAAEQIEFYTRGALTEGH